MTISQGFGKNSSDFVSWVVCSPQHDWTLALQTRTLEPTFDELNLSHRSRAAPRTGRTLVATWGTPILPWSISSTSSPCRWTGDDHVKMMIWMILILILIIMTTKNEKWTNARFFIHDVSPTEAALTKLENAFVLIGLNRFSIIIFIFGLNRFSIIIIILNNIFIISFSSSSSSLTALIVIIIICLNCFFFIIISSELRSQVIFQGFSRLLKCTLFKPTPSKSRFANAHELIAKTLNPCFQATWCCKNIY